MILIYLITAVVVGPIAAFFGRKLRWQDPILLAAAVVAALWVVETVILLLLAQSVMH
jgi:hypothetical protein